MLPINLVLSLFVLHFIGDFLLQSDWMAINKSKNFRALILHVLIYSLCFIPFGLHFVIITFMCHLLTDAITSQITSKLWFVELVKVSSPLSFKGPDQMYYVIAFPEGKGPSSISGFEYLANVKGGLRHWFFVVIGLDQLVHMVTLLITLRLLS